MTSNKFFNINVLFAFGIGGILFTLLFPLPPLLLDLLLVMNITISLMILLIMFYVGDPMEMSSFPALLLVITLYRLSLNVASTKLILLHGQAGTVIDAFGKFMVGNNYVIGTVVFLILVMINFMVITKGAGRIAEVAARFTLDSMPGKQMSIDADLNAGLIDETDAKNRRQHLSDEAEFYGAMDGASKFVKGDAVAGLVITGINIVGGLAIGVMQQQMELVDALETYTILTIGDGLVSQIPALLISIGAGLLVAKTATTGGLGEHLAGELFRRPEPVFICGAMMMVMAVLPGFPFLPFAVLSLLTIGFGYVLLRHGETLFGAPATPYGGGADGSTGEGSDKLLPAGQSGTDSATDTDDAVVPITPMQLEIGFSLVPLVDHERDGDLVARISMVRTQIRDEIGFSIPPISIQDNIELGNNEYRVMIRGLERARGLVQPGSSLAINPGDAMGQIEGIRTIDPAFGFEAIWINPQRTDAAEAMGYTVVETANVITTHVSRVAREYAAELLSRQDVKKLLDKVKDTDPIVVDELVPNQLAIGVVHRILQYLLAEQVPIHDLPSILETVSDYAGQTKDPLILSEYARQALKGHILSNFISGNGTLYAMTLQPSLEEEIRSSITQGHQDAGTNLSPRRAEAIVNQVAVVHGNIKEKIDADLVILVSPIIRPHLNMLIRRKVSDLPVISYAEVSDDINLQIVGTVKLAVEAQEFAAV